MRTIKSLATGCILSFALSISVIAGDMPGPGFVQDPPKTGPADQPGVCVNQTRANTPCEATPDPVTEATVIAIQLLTSVW